MAEEGIKVRFTGDASGVETASKKAAAALGKVSGAGGKASQAMINFGRVIQDAPYGIRGVANNIDPLIASLGGSAGLGIAVSVVTSALVVFGDQLFDTGGRMSATRKTIKDFYTVFGSDASNNVEGARKKLEEYQNSIDGIVNKNAEELSSVTLLVDRLQEGNLKRGESVAIIKKLQDIAPDYFGKLKAESASVSAVTAAYQLYNNEIIKTVEAQVRIAELGDIIKDRLDLSRQNKEAADYVDTLLSGGQSLEQIAGEIAKQRVEESKAITRAALANDVNTAAIEKQILLNSKVPLGVENIIRARQKEKKILDEINAVGTKTLGIKIADPVKVKELLLKPSTIGLDLSQTLKPEMAQLTRFELSDIIDTSKLTAPTSATIALPGVDLEKINATKEALKGLSEFAAEVGTAITVNLGGAFAGLFENILSGAQSAFQAFAQAIGNIIKKLIAAAAASALLSAILGPLGFVKDAGGNVLKGFSAFKSIFSKIGGFESGGIAQGPQSGYLTMLHGKEVVAPYKDFMSLMQGGNMGGSERLVAKISGSDLLFVLNRAQRNRGIIS
jgi:hypothetical protein